MTRISDSETNRTLIGSTIGNKQLVADLSNQLTSGLKATLPGDSTDAGAISRYQQTMKKIDSFTTVIAETKSLIQYQDEIMAQMNELMARGKEIAQQGANETLSPSARAHLSEEVLQIRDHVVGLANTSYQGRYIFGGADDDDPPYDASTYTVPATGLASQRYVFDNELGATTQRTVQITDELSMTTNTPANQLFDRAVQALERLGRGLQGYSSTLTSGSTDGGGVAYTFPADYTAQTKEIQDSITLLTQARDRDILPERVSLGGRLRRLETAESLLSLTKVSADEVLSRIQNVDETEAAANLAQAQNALEASYTVTARVLRLSILDYI
jgi:flagellar hook-associated protein 3 FlgL